MKRPFRIALIALASVVVALLVSVTLLPFLFEDRIVERLRVELNERLDADVDFADIDLTLLSTFPTLTAQVDELAVTGRGAFEGIDLFRARSVGAGLDLIALVLDERIEIQSVYVDEPRVHVVVTAEGAANYDILGELDDAQDEAGPDTPLALDVEDYEIRNGTLIYEEPSIDVVLVGLEHRGGLEVRGADQELRSKTEVKELSVRFGGVRYLKNARVVVDLDALVEGESAKLTIESLAIAINRLGMDGSGSLAWGGEGVDLDLAFASKEALPIKALVSAIPNAYAADFDGLETGGTFSLRGRVKGQLGPDDADIPSFDATARVKNGRLKYPDLPLAITDIELDAKVEHPGGAFDKLTLEVARYALAVGQSHGAGSLRVSRPLSGPNIDLTLEGRFDLAELAKAYPTPDVEGLEGLVEAKIDLAAKGQQISKLAGAISASGISYRPEGGPDLRVEEARFELSPSQTTIQKLSANVGTSDVNVRGVASPLTTFFSEDQTITASLWLTSKRLRVEDFLGEEATAEPADNTATASFVLPSDLDARLDLDVGTLTYGDLVLKSFKGSGRIKDRKLTLDGVRADALGGSMKLDGTLTTDPSRRPVFDIRYVVDKASFAEAFEALPSMRAYAPVARFLDGRFSTDFRASGTLDDDFSPKLDSVDAGGLVAALQSKLSSEFGPLQELNRALPVIPKPLDVEGFRTRFEIEDGAVEVKPFTTRTKGLAMTVSGRHGLDQEMKYRVSTEVPIDRLSAKLASEVQRLGLDLAKVDNVGVQANLTGSIKAPRISVEVDTGALRGAVTEALSAELAEQRARALQEAQEQADRIVAEAEKQAERIRQEAERAAERARKEGHKRADQLEREATGNPLKEVAAKQGAKRIRIETDKRADQAVAEANRRADQLVAEARKRASDLLRQADERSKKAADEAVKQLE